MPGFFGELEITTDNDAITVDANPGTIDADDYFIYSPVTAESFLDELAAKMTALAGFAITVTINSTTGKVTLAAGVSFAITSWETHEELGFAADNMSGASSYTGSKAAMYVWLPGREPADSLAPVTRQGTRRSAGSQVQAEDGTILTSRHSTYVDQELYFRHLSNAKTWGGTDNSSLEEFWLSTLSIGKPFLYMPDYPTDETYYWEYKARLREDEEKLLAVRDMPGSDVYWQYRMKLYGLS